MIEKESPAPALHTETGKEQSTHNLLRFSSTAPCTVCQWHWECKDRMRCLAYCRYNIREFERIGRDDPALRRLRHCRDTILSLGKRGLDR